MAALTRGVIGRARAGVVPPPGGPAFWVRWAARLASLVILLFLGAFFVEHTREWFFDPPDQPPPPWVWFSHAMHGLLLVGCLVGWRWEVAGGLLNLVGVGLFFGPVFHWGEPQSWALAAAAAAPGLLLLASAWLHRGVPR